MIIDTNKLVSPNDVRFYYYYKYLKYESNINEYKIIIN